jgi:hypothetical protein
MATKTIYLEKATEQILQEYCKEYNLSASKAINVLIQGNKPKKEKENNTKVNLIQKKKTSTKNLTFAQILANKRQNK